jgi:hypothetical protein
MAEPSEDAYICRANDVIARLTYGSCECKHCLVILVAALVAKWTHSERKNEATLIQPSDCRRTAATIVEYSLLSSAISVRKRFSAPPNVFGPLSPQDGKLVTRI